MDISSKATKVGGRHLEDEGSDIGWVIKAWDLRSCLNYGENPKSPKFWYAYSFGNSDQFGKCFIWFKIIDEFISYLLQKTIYYFSQTILTCSIVCKWHFQLKIYSLLRIWTVFAIVLVFNECQIIIYFISYQLYHHHKHLFWKHMYHIIVDV